MSWPSVWASLTLDWGWGGSPDGTQAVPPHTDAHQHVQITYPRFQLQCFHRSLPDAWTAAWWTKLTVTVPLPFICPIIRGLIRTHNGHKAPLGPHLLPLSPLLWPHQSCSSLRTFALTVPTSWSTFSKSPQGWIISQRFHSKFLFKCHFLREVFSAF